MDIPISAHMKYERTSKYRMALQRNGDAPVHRAFLVDKGHPEGKELHCVTCRGIIFILNERKYLDHDYALVTVFFARPGQARRLYKAIGEEFPEFILRWCQRWQRNWKDGHGQALKKKAACNA